MTPTPQKGGSKISAASTDQTVWTRDLKIVSFCRESENKVLIKVLIKKILHHKFISFIPELYNCTGSVNIDILQRHNKRVNILQDTTLLPCIVFVN